jgi:hypothetical protein
MRVIDKKITAILSVVIFIYFLSMAAYALLPDILSEKYNILIPSVAHKIFWYSNSTLVMFNMLLIFSKFVIETKPKILLIGSAFFFLAVGIFQILVILGFSFGKLWAFFCPCYFLFVIIIYRYVGNKLQK